MDRALLISERSGLFFAQHGGNFGKDRKGYFFGSFRP
jgi:hypothetical protein